MKRILLFSFLACFLTLAFTNDAYAQKKKTSKTDEYFDESGDFVSKLWYGLNVGNIGGFGGNFNINLSPMVGYELLPNLSVGAILKFNYQYIDNGQGAIGNFSDNRRGNRRLSAVDFSYGAFTRYKLFNVAFIHAELESTSFKVPRINENISSCTFDTCIDEDGKYETFKRQEPYFYVGGGYNGSNGGFGYELMLLYNVLDSANKSRIPWDFRVGLTWKF
ncbi:MAG: hypothetical protein ACJAYJ_004923 [Saprospiraceae bacterium]|jgi:hypothetical protein